MKQLKVSTKCCLLLKLIMIENCIDFNWSLKCKLQTTQQ